MFNRERMNEVVFNREPTEFVTLYATLSGRSGINATVKGTMTLQSELSAESTLTSDFYLLFAHLSASSGIAATQRRFCYMSAHLSGVSGMQPGETKYHVQTFEFSGDLAAGEDVTIDSGKMAATRGGLNILRLTNGEFLVLNTGTNALVYTDEESSRQLLIQVRHRDKFV